MYYLYFRNKEGRLCSTIHSLPLTEIGIVVGYDGDDSILEKVPCKSIDLSKYHKDNDKE